MKKDIKIKILVVNADNPNKIYFATKFESYFSKLLGIVIGVALKHY